MVIISNQQRDDIERFLTAYTATLDTKRTRDYNTRRLVMKLLRGLERKKPVPFSDLPEQLKRSR